jgi:hypothetical protein
MSWAPSGERITLTLAAWDWQNAERDGNKGGQQESFRSSSRHFIFAAFRRSRLDK